MGQSAPCCSWSAVFHPLSFKIRRAPSCPPGISHIFTPVSAALGVCWSRDKQSWAASLCPSLPSHQLHGAGKALPAVAAGRAETSLPAAASPMLLVARAASCPVSSARHAAQLTFPRWQIKVLVLPWLAGASPVMLCWGTEAVALSRAALWLAPGRCLQPRAGTLNGMLGRFVSRECPALARQGGRGCCRLAAPTLLVWGLVTTGNPRAVAHRPITGIALTSILWQGRYAFTKMSGHYRTTDGCFATDRQHAAVAHLRAAGKRPPVAEGCLGGMC